MEPLIPTLTFEQLRQAKKNASSTLTSLGIELSSSTTGNLVASTLGYKDWNTAKALTSKNDIQSYDDRENGTIFITPRSDNNEIDTPHHPALSAPDDMSPSDRSIFMQAVRDCATSIRLSHLEGINNEATVDKILEDAVLITYNRVGEKAIFSSLMASLKSVEVPESMASLKGDMLYLLSNKNPIGLVNYYAAVVSAGKKRELKKKPLKYDLVEVQRNGAFDSIKAKAGSYVSLKEKYLWKAVDINFDSSQSTALFGASGCGKSNLMLGWANALENNPDGMPYVYLLTKLHKSGTVLDDIKIKTTDEVFDQKDQSGIIFVDDDNDDFATYRGLLQKAMSDGRHIFIDENVFMFDMLDEVVRAGYQNYTIAMQSVRSLFEHNNIVDISRYGFGRALIGKQNELSSIRYLKEMDFGAAMPFVNQISRGEFYLLQSVKAA